ncbi:hypothetical protein [Spiroplasma sp. DGKH1]|uniref:hypothetical protein n=1 Tax=Spiroplasma sp. DGKH1 TaxID=3050074 RepID=UPI0034C6CC08
MAQHVVNGITITYEPQVLQEIIGNLAFPMLAFDFEAYHFRKDYQLYDHLQDSHSKPFLIGTSVLSSLVDLQTKPLDELINYQYHLNWTINNKKQQSLKSFAHFLNRLVLRKKIKTFLVLGKDLEMTILNYMAKKQMFRFNLDNIKIIDIYDLYHNQNILRFSHPTGEVITVKQPDYVLQNDELYQILLKNDNHDKDYWDKLWRTLDALYTYDHKHLNHNLYAFQKAHLREILQKNHDDLVKMVNLLKILVTF